MGEKSRGNFGYRPRPGAVIHGPHNAWIHCLTDAAIAGEPTECTESCKDPRVFCEGCGVQLLAGAWPWCPH